MESILGFFRQAERDGEIAAVRKGAGTQFIPESGREGAEYILEKLKEKFII